jgi:hypothetical protein
VQLRILITLAIATFAGACALGVSAGADYSPTVDFSPYTSFTWDEPGDRPIGDPRLENNPLFQARLNAAITLELHDVGIQEGAEGPGLMVHYHATVRNRVEVYEADTREGYPATDYGEGTQVVQFEEGTILVDIADAETGDIIWRGWAQFDIGRALTNPDVMANAINESISQMFRRFPKPR